MTRPGSYQRLLVSVREETGLPAAAVKAVVEALAEAVLKRVSAGEKVNIRGLGHFFARERAARVTLHPITRKKLKVRASSALAFKPIRRLTRLAKKP
jgi:nucleoid DNA-binding protein